MTKTGPIVIIEDDDDDRDLMRSAFDILNIPNEIIMFHDGNEAYNYLLDKTVKPFVVISDINMPKISGFALRDQIHKDDELREKCIPYLFMTTATSPSFIKEAYKRSVRGFFIKPNNFSAIAGYLEENC